MSKMITILPLWVVTMPNKRTRTKLGGKKRNDWALSRGEKRKLISHTCPEHSL